MRLMPLQLIGEEKHNTRLLYLYCEKLRFADVRFDPKNNLTSVRRNSRRIRDAQ